MGFLSKLKQAFTKNKDADRYMSGLNRSKKRFSDRIRALALGFSGVNESFLEDLMETLLEADLGIETAEKIVNEVENRAIDKRMKKFDEIVDCLIEVMRELYGDNEGELVRQNNDGPTVILMVGVNGSGKTTTSAKLTKFFQADNKQIAVAAGDTFRAGAIEQLARWADKLGVHCIKGKENSDPSATMVDACRYAKEHNVDYLICDTAGRLQNKVNLMNELEKMNRIIKRVVPNGPQETLLVIDATTGQNGVSQAQEFSKITDITGIVLTKMDGTAKGGIVLSIKDHLNIPVKFIGLGESMDDLQEFDLEQYIYGLCKNLMEE